MNCPVCDERLRTVEKYGLEIDLCPGCKGVWLDRGKLETILNQAASQPVGSSNVPRAAEPIGREAAPAVLPPAYRHDEHDDHDHDDHRDQHDRQTEHHQDGRNPKRRSSLLGDLLGVFGSED